jgi:RNA polymerase sigma-70 factor (ECF subfamily)
LKQRLERRGVSLGAVAGATGLIALIETNAVQAAPIGLAASACAAATGSAGVGLGISIAKGAMTMMTWTKAKIAATVVAAAMIGGAGGLWTINNALAQNKNAGSSAPAAASENKPKPKRTGMTLAKAPPVVVATTPRAGDDAVDPNLTELKVTFSKDMEDGNWSWAQISDDTYPETTGKPHYEDDARTCVLPVKLKPGQTYVILLNKPPFTSFVDQDGHKALEYWLVFQTKP